MGLRVTLVNSCRGKKPKAGRDNSCAEWRARVILTITIIDRLTSEALYLQSITLIIFGLYASRIAGSWAPARPTCGLRLKGGQYDFD
jgi:hypothetical protein